MKELGNSFAQLAAIIMVLITLAVSTAAVSQWASNSSSDDAATTHTLSAQDTTRDQSKQTQPAPAPLISGARP